ncbi:TPA: hypothetical protein O1J55_003969 [Escherichia coli]|uniref:hypothetical protein n=1 Tax=Escherichia coli TaxID=562 RepID=UPI001C1F9AC0|nr:hypothetical protein [Escherichia coli]QWX19287.1 hypothetical protein JJE78_13885 [Escherichia coli]WBZ89502.1 hypothetical protein PIC88_14080 [Escherichia coli]HCY2110837.1 hypothetical protein [Escherichia coli]HCY2580398.1 hypothetical protein [Escherichia coli]
MTKSTITREQLIKKAQEQIEFCRHTKITGEGRAHVNQCAALFEIALAAMDSEPVAYMYDGEDGTEYNGHNEFSGGGKGIPLYRHAQPAPQKYNIGDATMRHIFTPTGMTNVSNMQAVFDRVEAVLVGMEQSVPVVPVTDAMAYAFHHALTDSPLGDDDVEDIKAGLRAALVYVFNTQPAPQEVHDEK